MTAPTWDRPCDWGCGAAEGEPCDKDCPVGQEIREEAEACP